MSWHIVVVFVYEIYYDFFIYNAHWSNLDINISTVSNIYQFWGELATIKFSSSSLEVYMNLLGLYSGLAEKNSKCYFCQTRWSDVDSWNSLNRKNKPPTLTSTGMHAITHTNKWSYKGCEKDNGKNPWLYEYILEIEISGFSTEL